MAPVSRQMQVYGWRAVALMRESDVQNAIRKAASEREYWTWRNNNGACVDGNTGRQIRYGLANDSKQVNAVFKSSDLIGITPRLVTQRDVGLTWGVFTAIEVKPTGWHYRGDAREAAQLAFINTVRGAGGLAGFAPSVAHYLDILGVT